MRPARAALAVTLAVCSCSPADETGVLVTLRVEAPSLRPEYAVVTWQASDGSVMRDSRVPASGVFSSSGAVLGSLYVALDASSGGERQVTARGMRAEREVSRAEGRITPVPGRRLDMTLVLGPLPAGIEPPPDAGVFDALRDAAAPAPPIDSLPGVDAPVPSMPDAGLPSDPPPAARDVAEEAGGACAASPPPTLMGHFKFDETAGTTANDSSCNQLKGMLLGYTSGDWRPGRIGGALGFDGVKQWVKVPDVSDRLDAIATTNKITVAAWFKPTVVPTNQWGVLVQRQITGNPLNEHFALGTNFSKVGFGTFHNSCYAPTPLTAGAWYHVAGTFDGTSNNGVFYVNGAQACTFTSADDFMPDTTPFTIGGGSNTTDQNAASELINGTIDEVLLYSRVLTAAEIAAIAAGGAPPTR